MAYEALLCAALNPGCLGLIGAPTYPMLRDTTQRALLGVLEEEGIGYELHRQTETLSFTDHEVFGGAQIIFRSLDTADRLRGTNLAWFGVDELTYCREDAWPILEGRLREPRAWHHTGFAVWTPKGFDWVYEKFIKDGGDGQYQAVLAAPMENRHLPPDFYESLRKSYDERNFAQEVLGQYINVRSGRVYHAFDDRQNVQAVEFDERQTLYWSLDFNINPMCSVLAQRPTGGAPVELQVIDELMLPHCSTREACEAFHERTRKWMRAGRLMDVLVTGDPAGNARQHATGASDFQIVKTFFREHAHNYRARFEIRRSHAPVRDRVSAVNAMLCNQYGERRLTVSPRCKELIRDLQTVGYREDGSVDKSDLKRTHLSDALGYLVDLEFPLHAKIGIQQRETII